MHKYTLEELANLPIDEVEDLCRNHPNIVSLAIKNDPLYNPEFWGVEEVKLLFKRMAAKRGLHLDFS